MRGARCADPAPPRLDGNAEFARRYERQARMPFNLTGNPALVIPVLPATSTCPCPCSWSATRSREATLYRIAQVYETATGWIGRHPPLGN